MRDCLFVMQNIEGHYIKWSEPKNRFEITPSVKVNICHASVADKLAFLGFLGESDV